MAALSGKITYFRTEINKVKNVSISTKSKEEAVATLVTRSALTLLNSLEKSDLSSFPLK